MITILDLLTEMVSQNGWEVRERIFIGTAHYLINIRRTGFKYNVIIEDHNVKVLNTLKDTDYIEADVSLFDPASTDQLEKIFQ